MYKSTLIIKGTTILNVAFATVICAMIPLAAWSQHIITLEEALTLASKQNNKILRAKADQEVAEESRKEKHELRIPEVDFHTSYARITDITEFKKGLREKAVTSSIPEWADVSASAKLPIYAGGEIRHLVTKAKQENAIAILRIEKTSHDIQLQVAATFLGVYKLLELQKIINENIIEEEDRLKEVKAFKARGTVTGNEVLRAELQVSEMRLKLLSNKRNIAIGLHELHILLQIPEDQHLNIDTTNLLARSLPLESYENYSAAADHKDEMRIARQEEYIMNTERRLVKSNYYPKISLMGSYGLNYPNYLFFPPNPNFYTLGKIGIDASFSLSNLYKNRTKVQLADKKIAAKRIEIAILNDELKEQIYKHYTQYLEITDKLPLNEKAKQLAEENYRIVKLKYLNQLALVTDMIDADNALLQTKFNVVATKIDALMKYYELRHAAGLLSSN